MHPRKVSSIGWFWRVDIWQCRICRFHFFHFRLGASCKTASIRPPGPELNSVAVQIYANLHRPSVSFSSGADLIQYMHLFSSGEKLWPKFPRIFPQMHLVVCKVCCVKESWQWTAFEWFVQQMAEDIYIKSLFREVSEHLWWWQARDYTSKYSIGII